MDTYLDFNGQQIGLNGHLLVDPTTSIIVRPIK